MHTEESKKKFEQKCKNHKLNLTFDFNKDSSFKGNKK